MSPKDLLYLKDAIEHAKFIHNKCHILSSEISCEKLQGAIKEVQDTQKKIFDDLYKVVVSHSSKGGNA